MIYTPASVLASITASAPQFINTRLADGAGKTLKTKTSCALSSHTMELHLDLASTQFVLLFTERLHKHVTWQRTAQPLTGQLLSGAVPR